MTALSDSEKLGDDACASLRRSLRRGKQLTADARQRLSELTSDSIYPGLADVILTDPSNLPIDSDGDDAPLPGPSPKVS